jgi:hypothetical protein
VLQLLRSKQNSLRTCVHRHADAVWREREIPVTRFERELNAAIDASLNNVPVIEAATILNDGNTQVQAIDEDDDALSENALKCIACWERAAVMQCTQCKNQMLCTVCVRKWRKCVYHCSVPVDALPFERRAVVSVVGIFVYLTYLFL